MRPRFTQSFKIQAVEKALNRQPGTGLKDVALSLGVGYSTLEKWIVKVTNHELDNRTPINLMENQEKRPQDWSSSDRLQAIIESSALSGEELSAYCRKKGIYTHHLEQWKQQFLKAELSESVKAEKTEIKFLKDENKQLKKELHRKEKALAEAAALLILKKKVNYLLGNDEDD